MTNLHKTIRNLIRDERGNIAMTFGLSSVLAVAAVGASVDYGRTISDKSSMQMALDAAVIAAVTDLGNGKSWSVAQNSALATFRVSFSDAVSPTANNPNPTANRGQPVVSFTRGSGNSSQVSANAKMTTSTPFIKIVAGTDLTTAATSSGDPSGTIITTATSQRKKHEVGIMVDLTGSMGETRNGITKIAALKAASTDLLDILLPASGANNDAVRVGIAPFADYVNAGPYASAATGLAATGGAFNNITNLAWTKNGTFYGNYSGATASSSGSQAGATPPTSGSSSGGSGSTAGNGATYNNAYCTNPTSTVTTTTNLTRTTTTFGTANIGTSSNYGVQGSVNAPYYFQSGGTWYYVSQAGYTSNGRPWGYLYYQNSNNNQGNGNWRLYSNNMYYNSHIPNSTSNTTTTVVTGCESDSTSVTSNGVVSKLISCVTERTDSANRYKASSPSSGNGYVGAFNHGDTRKYNYSSDGKCWVAGRELPAVIPLTNNRATLTSFFQNATIGGGTPGHLGTAWASYLVSPDWSSVWPSVSQPVAYTDTGTVKSVILMTDGEYNIYYNGSASVTQAKATCDEMKAKGVQIFSVGFGFSTSSQPNDGSAEGNAKGVLSYCATSTAHYFVPYDSAALRTAFQNIGNTLSTQMTTTTTVEKRGARIRG